MHSAIKSATDLSNLVKKQESDFQKKMEEMATKIEKQHQDHGDKLDKQFGPEFELKIEKQFGPDFQKKMEEMSQKLEREFKNFPELKGQPDTTHKRVQLHLKQNGSGQSRFEIGGHGFDALHFMNTLSPAQKDAQRKVGYLWYNDLSAEQKHLFDSIDGKFDIDLKVNGDEVRVRRN